MLKRVQKTFFAPPLFFRVFLCIRVWRLHCQPSACCALVKLWLGLTNLSLELCSFGVGESKTVSASANLLLSSSPELESSCCSGDKASSGDDSSPRLSLNGSPPSASSNCCSFDSQKQVFELLPASDASLFCALHWQIASVGKEKLPVRLESPPVPVSVAVETELFCFCGHCGRLPWRKNWLLPASFPWQFD